MRPLSAMTRLEERLVFHWALEMQVISRPKVDAIMFFMDEMCLIWNECMPFCAFCYEQCQHLQGEIEQELAMQPLMPMLVLTPAIFRKPLF